ncbi:MAG: hypothetical protein GY853_06080 [PVC group bacterium]|nr:hypothetical protein [PVC group bacterium]
MKKCILGLVLIIGLSGCAPAQSHLAHFRKDVERTNKIEEKIFNYSYAEVFTAIVQVLNDTVTTIYEKDFDEGVILGKNDLGISAGDFQKPSHNFGFWLENMDKNRTKVILRMVDVHYLMAGTAEDEFNLIQKELETRVKLKNKQGGGKRGQASKIKKQINKQINKSEKWKKKRR